MLQHNICICSNQQATCPRCRWRWCQWCIQGAFEGQLQEVKQIIPRPSWFKQRGYFLFVFSPAKQNLNLKVQMCWHRSFLRTYLWVKKLELMSWPRVIAAVNKEAQLRRSARGCTACSSNWQLERREALLGFSCRFSWDKVFVLSGFLWAWRAALSTPATSFQLSASVSDRSEFTLLGPSHLSVSVLSSESDCSDHSVWHQNFCVLIGGFTWYNVSPGLTQIFFTFRLRHEWWRSQWYFRLVCKLSSGNIRWFS